MVAITLTNTSVDFPIYGPASRSLKKSLMGAHAGGRINHDAKDRITVQALRSVSLDIREGERIGLIGPNGAGKSTLLRTIAGIYEPTGGQVKVSGQITTLFSLNIGIENEATGFENITLRALAAGMSRPEIERQIDDIAEFTELGEYLNFPIYTYSAGMRARLSFAISTAIAPEILLMDEWLGAGDASFIEKARNRLEMVVHGARILLLASHNKQLLSRICNKFVELEAGRVRSTDSVRDPGQQ